jgi:hypothetical protein
MKVEARQCDCKHAGFVLFTQEALHLLKLNDSAFRPA